MDFIVFSKASAPKKSTMGFISTEGKQTERFVLLVSTSDDPPSQVVMDRAEALVLKQQITKALNQK